MQRLLDHRAIRALGTLLPVAGPDVILERRRGLEAIRSGTGTMYRTTWFPSHETTFVRSFQFGAPRIYNSHQDIVVYHAYTYSLTP